MLENKRIVFLKIIICLAILCLVGCGASEDTLSINGIYIGKKVSTDREHLVMDDSFSYMEDNVGYNVDGENCVENMSFYRIEDNSGEEIYGLSNMNIFYHGEHLDTTEKIINCFGENYVSDTDKDYETLFFEDDELIVEISLKQGEFIGIEVGKNRK